MKSLLLILIITTGIYCYGQSYSSFNGTFINGISKDDLCYDRAIYPLPTTSISLTSSYNYTNDTIDFIRINNIMPNLRSIIIQNAIFSKIPNVLINSVIQTLSISLSSATDFPLASDGSQIRTLIFDQMNTIPSSIPLSWSKMRYVNNIYLRLNGYNTAQLNNIISQFESLVNAGMGQLTTGTHSIYLNQLGINQNLNPTLSIFTNAGWVQSGTAQTSKLTKTILGNVWQIFYNP